MNDSACEHPHDRLLKIDWHVYECGACGARLTSRMLGLNPRARRRDPRTKGTNPRALRRRKRVRTSAEA